MKKISKTSMGNPLSNVLPCELVSLNFYYKDITQENIKYAVKLYKTNKQEAIQIFGPIEILISLR
mgnify:CR=1 FL=1